MNWSTRRLIGSHALAALGMSIPWPALLVLVERETSSALVVGLAAAARLAPYVALSWLSGRLADRRERAFIVRLSLVTRITALFGCAVALHFGSWTWALAAATAAIVAGTPAYPALAAGIPSLAGQAREQATRLLVTVEVASFVVGPAVGGLLLDRLPIAAIALCSALTVAVGAVLFIGIALPSPVSGELESVAEVACEPSSVAAVLRTNPAARQALWTVVALNVITSAIGLLLLDLTGDTWQTGASGFGLLTAALGAGGLAAPLLAPLAARLTMPRTIGAISLAVIVVLGIPGFANGGGVVTIMALAAMGALAVEGESLATSVIQMSVAEDCRASVLGLADSAMIGAAMIASVVAPVAGSMFGPVGATVALAVFAVVAAAVAAQFTSDKSRASRSRQSARGSSQ